MGNIYVKAKGIARKYIGYGSFRIKMRLVLYNMSMFFNFRKFNRIEEDDIYDYKSAILSKRLFRHASYYGNIMYGMDWILNNYTQTKSIYSGYIEHGLYLNESAEESLLYRSIFNQVITFSSFREGIIKKANNSIKISKIGPYIHYAEPKSAEYITSEKKKNGKTLLVFPQHSTDDISVDYSIDELIGKIEELKKKYKYNTVLICLYYRDIQMERDKKYSEAGYRVVCSGYKEDPLFLSRQKTFILMSDAILSNDVGTYVGYAVFYKKPVYVWKQKREFIDVTGISKTLGKSVDNIISDDRNSLLEDAFSDDSMILTDEQYNLCSYFWGFESIKSKTELIEYYKN